MIKFKAVRWKNFLSTGDKFTTIQLDRSPSTLIVGHNGAGKSTLLDALSFGLFGKAHRDIKKDQLVNSINMRGAIVEVEFDIGVHTFKIIRGIKPGKFEIWQNGNMINQSSASRDYQKFLEQNILKLNHKSFHQIVVLGSSSFIPFMQLSTGQRREVIEDLLDIQVFSKMNQILKERSGKLKEEINDSNYKLDVLKEKVNIQRKYIRDITEINDEQINSKHAEIALYRGEIEELQGVNTADSNYISLTQDKLTKDLKANHDRRQAILNYQAQFQQQIKTIVKEAKFYEEHENCPTCTQSISPSIRDEKLKSSQEKAKTLQEALVHASEQSASLESVIDGLNDIAETIRNKSSNITANNNTITRLQRQIHALENDIANLNGKEGDLGKANQELQESLDSKEEVSEIKLRLMEEKTYNDAAGEMLKDTGIKTKVIKQYLPVMNKLVNNYLQVLDFFVSFNLDENFNEIIKSRHRDSFNYASFSEGEKQRIDLALLFTWRQIARMKNSTSTNLLVLDETFDSSLDHDGVDNLIKILGTLDNDTNVFVISHKGDLLDGKFRSKIEFIKEHNFSQMLA
jgi:DNA repair exonuclease SbcCD ATPase subunit